ncbi:MAG: hypothetical protein NC131_16115 [Roseburia sp.]|nr:hypothetical protein [Roseburia sp.]
MAFYAELVRRQWYCVNQFNAIRWYRKKRYDDWYNSMSKEEQEAYERRKEAREAEERDAAMRSLTMLMSLPLMLAMRHERRMFDEKYGGVYNYDGTPNLDFFIGKEDSVIDTEAAEL